MLEYAIPVLHVGSAARALEFYREKLGFEQKFSYRIDETRTDPCYFGMARDGVWLHLSSFPGDGGSGGGVYIGVEDVDALHEELRAKGVVIDTGPIDQDWGNREMYVKDPDGNS